MKTVKAFLIDDRYVTSNSSNLNEVLEISDYSLTFSKERNVYTSSLDSNLSLQVFKLEETLNLTQEQVNDIIKVVTEFISNVNNSSATDKSVIIANFINYIQNNTTLTVTNFNYNNLIVNSGKKIPDYVTFTLNNDIIVNLWLKDALFREFYPHYDIDIVFPFSNFSTIINNTSEFITALDNFNLIEFNSRIEEAKENRISTYTRILNIPYKVPNTNIYKNCYFAFIIYGQQGNYEHILKLYLYDYLKNNIGLTDTIIQNLFPNILEINEFFIVPRWNKIAIPSHVGSSAIFSQVTKTYSEPFDLDKFIKVYDNNFLLNNTYSLPVEYDNMLLLVTNGKFTQNEYKDFYNYYSDILAITSLDPDFPRMSTRTQNFITLVENMIVVCNCNNSTEFLNNVINNTNYQFNIINRVNIDYLTIYFDRHQYYMLPKYEFVRLNV